MTYTWPGPSPLFAGVGGPGLFLGGVIIFVWFVFACVYRLQAAQHDHKPDPDDRVEGIGCKFE